MIWSDTGFLISKNRYNENSVISEIFTKNHGKTVGIIFGGTSKKVKNYLQIGNQLHINYNSKSDSRIGYFKIEIEKALSPFYFDNKQKLSCINSAMQLIKILTAESQSNKFVFNLIKNFYLIIDSKDWVKDYIFWELELFKALGYDLNLEKLVDKKIVDDQLKYFATSSTEKKIVPNFLIEKTKKVDDISDLLIGLKLIGDYLDKTILKPNNLSHPINRINFINTLK